MNKILTSAREDIEKLTKNDVVIVIGGTNDISKNDAKQGTRNLTIFMSNCRNTNVIVTTAPPRHDLVDWSCINKEVINFNNDLRKRATSFENVKVVSMESNRTHYTKHGLHMNNFGKEIFAKKLTEAVKKTICESNQKKEPIVLRWKEDTATLDIEVEPESDKGGIRRSERTRKPPQKLSNDFL